MNGKKEKIKKCPICGGKMEDGITVIPFLFQDDKIAVIKNVPAEICSDCGEAYMKSSVVSRIENLLDQLNELQSEVSVIQYKAA